MTAAAALLASGARAMATTPEQAAMAGLALAVVLIVAAACGLVLAARALLGLIARGRR